VSHFSHFILMDRRWVGRRHGLEWRS